MFNMSLFLSQLSFDGMNVFHRIFNFGLKMSLMSNARFSELQFLNGCFQFLLVCTLSAFPEGDIKSFVI